MKNLIIILLLSFSHYVKSDTESWLWFRYMDVAENKKNTIFAKTEQRFIESLTIPGSAPFFVRLDYVSVFHPVTGPEKFGDIIDKENKNIGNSIFISITYLILYLHYQMRYRN